jgi:hypothetical protein
MAVAAGLLLLDAGNENRLLHVAVFYAFTLCAFAALPWNRKADVALGAVCLAAGWETIHGVTTGESRPQYLALDVCGIALAAAPVWIARLRQIAQQDRLGSERWAERQPRVRHLRAWVTGDAAHGS